MLYKPKDWVINYILPLPFILSWSYLVLDLSSAENDLSIYEK